MKQIEKVASAANFAAISVGNLNELSDYVLELGPGVKIPGKVFGGAALQTTGGARGTLLLFKRKRRVSS